MEVNLDRKTPKPCRDVVSLSVVSQFYTLPLAKGQEMTRDSDAKARAKIPRAPS